MALALAQEKLHYDPVQIEALSHQIRMGDLTPIMQLYEQDIKRPLKSAIAGSLIRTLFIQVQKAKVVFCFNSFPLQVTERFVLG